MIGTTMKLRSLVSLLAVLMLPLSAIADQYKLPNAPVFKEECGSCHLIFPPQMLDAESWRGVMAGLPDHFGTDASLDEKQRLLITDILVSHAGGRKTGETVDAMGKSLLRITETSRFIRKHREIQPAVWRRASIKSPANCSVCHTQASTGRYSDDNIKIPK